MPGKGPRLVSLTPSSHENHQSLLNTYPETLQTSHLWLGSGLKTDGFYKAPQVIFMCSQECEPVIKAVKSDLWTFSNITWELIGMQIFRPYPFP